MRELLIIALALAIIAWQHGRLEAERAAHAQTRTGMETAAAEHERAARLAADSYRALEQQWRTDMQEITADARLEVERADAARAAADDAAGRLRVQYAAALASRCPAAPASTAAGGSPPAGSAADLLADVQRRLDEAAGELAAFADRARVAGLACERVAAGAGCESGEDGERRQNSPRGRVAYCSAGSTCAPISLMR